MARWISKNPKEKRKRPEDSGLYLWIPEFIWIDTEAIEDVFDYVRTVLCGFSVTFDRDCGTWPADIAEDILAALSSMGQWSDAVWFQAG